LLWACDEAGHHGREHVEIKEKRGEERKRERRGVAGRKRGEKKRKKRAGLTPNDLTSFHSAKPAKGSPPSNSSTGWQSSL
jgi:hypothetical protein